MRKTEATVAEDYYSKIGDVIIPTSGETAEDIATATCVMKPGVILAGDLCIMRPSKIDGRFLSYTINHKAKYDIARIAQGKSVVHIRPEEVEQVKVCYPGKPEQEKILHFIELLSQKIEKQKVLIESLKLYKRGLIQKIFEQIIPSRDCTEITIEGLFDNIIDKGHPTETVLTIVQGVGTIPRDAIERRISYNQDSVSTYKRVEKNDFIMHLRSFEGGLEIANEYGIVSPAYTILRAKQSISPEFYYSYFRSYSFINDKLRITVEGIRDGKSINMPSFWKIKIPFPAYEIQKTYGNLISRFEKRLSLAEEQLTNMNKLKRYFLTNLFI